MNRILTERTGWNLFLTFAFFSGCSMPIARVCLLLSLAVTLHDRIKNKKSIRISPPGWGFFVYFAVACFVSAIAAAACTDGLIDPAAGFMKLDKLIWYLGIPLGATLIDSRERLVAVLKSLVLGCGVTALSVILLNPAGAWLQITMPSRNDIARGDVSSFQRRLLIFSDALGIRDAIHKWMYSGGWRARTFADSIIKLGTMEGAQRLMTAFPASVWLAWDAQKNMPRGSRPAQRFAAYALPVLIFLGLAVTFKRGPLFAAVIVTLPLAWSLFPKRIFAVALAISVIAVLVMPAARKRILELPDEFSTARGGRMAMWTEIAPALREEHPFGIGFRALTYDKMKSIFPKVELRQDHLHSVPLQSLVDFGYPGLAAYFLWMFLSLKIPVKAVRRRVTDACVPLAALSALILYGLMEYNIADGEVVLLYAILMGAGSSVYLKQKTDGMPNQQPSE